MDIGDQRSKEKTQTTGKMRDKCEEDEKENIN